MVAYAAAEAALSILVANPLPAASPALASRLGRTNRALRYTFSQHSAAADFRKPVKCGAAGHGSKGRGESPAQLAAVATGWPSRAAHRIHAFEDARGSVGAGVTLLEQEAAATDGAAAAPDVQLVLDRQILAAIRSRDLPAARQAYQQLQAGGGFPSERACEGLLKGLCRGDAFPAAWPIYQDVQRQGVPLRYSVFQSMINAANKAGEAGIGLRVFRDIQEAGMQPNVVTYCGAISGLARSRRPDQLRKACRLWVELRASGQLLDAAAFRTGINVCVEAGDLGGGHKAAGDMRAAGLPPDARAHNILLKGYVRAGLLSLLPDLVADMQLEGLPLDKVSYATLIEAHVRAGQLADAAGWAAAAGIAGVKLDAWAYTSLLKGHAQAGDAAATEAVLTDMRAAGVAPNAVTYTLLVDAQVRRGNLKAARELIVHMEAEGQAPTAVTYNTLLRGYTAKGRAGRGGAAWVLQRMQAAGLGPDSATWNTLMAAALANGDAQAAVDMFAKMRSAGRRPDAVTYTTLIQAHSHLGSVDAAAAAYRRLRDDRSLTVDESALCAYIGALAHAGRFQQAHQLLPQAVRLAAGQGRQPPLAAYGALVAGYARRRRLQEALEVVQALVDAGGAPDLQIYERLVDLAMRVGNYDRAMKDFLLCCRSDGSIGRSLKPQSELCRVVRVMEGRGFRLDKAKMQALFAELCRREEAARRACGPEGSCVPKADATAAATPNENLERFKFWLGLPNQYYASDPD